VFNLIATDNKKTLVSGNLYNIITYARAGRSSGFSRPVAGVAKYVECFMGGMEPVFSPVLASPRDMLIHTGQKND
jgi:hypothetical protein